MVLDSASGDRSTHVDRLALGRYCGLGRFRHVDVCHLGKSCDDNQQCVSLALSERLFDFLGWLGRARF
jgi:hypothetical protein